MVNSPACPQYHHQVSLFPQLNRIDLCKGSDKRISRRSGALLRDNLGATWGRVKSLKISAFTGPGPSLSFPSLTFEKLQVRPKGKCQERMANAIQTAWAIDAST